MGGETKDEVLGFRIPSEELPLLQMVIEYRNQQGLIQKKTLSEYIRYCMNRDITEVITLIIEERR